MGFEGTNILILVLTFKVGIIQKGPLFLSFEKFNTHVRTRQTKVERVMNTISTLLFKHG
jgi:hypothetical protein